MMKHECKVTVIDKKCFADFQEQYLADIDSIHRITIYKATARKDKDWKYTL